MRTRTFAITAGMLFCAASAAAEGVVVFRGNVLFDELVYRSILQLPDSTPATAADALAAAARLRSFLRRAGYELATVNAGVTGGQIVIDIDEGRLDKIVVIGEGLVETLRFRVELALPSDVFNRPILERQLRLLGQRYRLNHYSYDLVPAEVQLSHGPQIDELEPLLKVPGVLPGLRYSLHVSITSSPWARGFAPDLSIGSPEGLGAGGRYREQDFFVHDDRWELRGRVAGGVRQYLDVPGSRPVFTRALAEARWFSPPVFTDSLRPALTARADLLSLQRADLHLEGFEKATYALSLDAGVFRPLWTVAVGGGIERRFLFGIVKAAGADPLIDQSPLAPRAQTRPYGEAIAEVTFNEEELRNDRKHRLAFEGRLYTGSRSSGSAIWLRADWQRRFPFGWHEFLWSARGTLLAGEVLFPDEESLGEHLGGAFGGNFARKLASTKLEFRYSLLRDVLKVGVFYGQVLFGAIDRASGRSTPASAGAGGPAVHLLLADEFQIDLYVAVGWKTDGSADFAPALVMRQVF